MLVDRNAVPVDDLVEPEPHVLALGGEHVDQLVERRHLGHVGDRLEE